MDCSSFPTLSQPIIIKHSSFAFISISIATVLWFLIHRLVQHNSADPKTWPIIGCSREVSQNFRLLHDWMSQYFTHDHRTIKMKVFSRCTFATVDPANVEYILKTNFKNYPKGEEMHYRLYDMLGDGILNSDGELWRSQRKIALVQFSHRNLKDLGLNVFRQNAVRLMTLLARSTGKVDIHDLFMRMTLDSICKIGFSVDLGCLSPSLPSVSFATAFDSVNEIISRRFLNPFWRIQRYFNIGSEKLLLQDLQEIKSFTTKVIKERRVRLSSENDEGINKDLLWRFMSCESGESGKTIALNDAILNFVIAGRDTTGLTLSWFVYCICQHPHTMDLIFNEVQQVLNLHHCVVDHRDIESVAKLLTYDSINKMHYLHAALTETLRLYPAVPRDGKVAAEDDVLPDGRRVKKGDQVVYIPYSMGRMEFLWGEDAHMFKPERWLRDGVFHPQSPFKFTAFQAGPRICLGKDFAYFQMKMAAALLIYFFRIKLAPHHPVSYRIMQVLAMTNGLHVSLSSRHAI